MRFDITVQSDYFAKKNYIRVLTSESKFIVSDLFKIMPPVVQVNRKLERYERKRTCRIKRPSRRCNYKLGSIMPKKEFQRKNINYDLHVEDIVFGYNLPVDNAVNFPTAKSIQKRKLSTDEYDSDWAPAKTQRNDESLIDYLSSQIVPNWTDTELERSCLLSSEDDIQILTVDEVIEFDSTKSPCEHDPFESPICFGINELFEIVESEESSNEEDLSTDKPKNVLDVLLTFTNNSQLVLYEDQEKELKEVKQIQPYSSLFECNDSCEVEDNQDQWHNDGQIEKFNFGRCFKCRKKVYKLWPCIDRRKCLIKFHLITQVYIMRDCPRHGTK